MIVVNNRALLPWEKVDAGQSNSPALASAGRILGMIEVFIVLELQSLKVLRVDKTDCLQTG
jgi:hypothetical protein